MYPQQLPPVYAYYPPGQKPLSPPPPPKQFTHSEDSQHDVEAGKESEYMEFTEQSVRSDFVKKVFMLVAVMLSVVTAMTAVPFINPEVDEFIRTHEILYLLSFVIFMGVYVSILCGTTLRRSFPMNIIFLVILTLSLGYMTMMITARFKIESVALCLLITAVCCTMIMLFATFTRYDATSCIGVVFILSIFVAVFGVVACMSTIFFQIRFLFVIYAGLAALMLIAYLVIDVQMIMGERELEISPEEYVFAASQIFVDVVQLFWMFLMLFGGNRRN